MHNRATGRAISVGSKNSWKKTIQPSKSFFVVVALSHSILKYPEAKSLHDDELMARSRFTSFDRDFSRKKGSSELKTEKLQTKTKHL